MRTLLAVLALLGAALGVTSDEKKPCDLKQIEKAPYCEFCDQIDPKVNEEGLCENCEEKPTKVDVCVKTYFTCDKCGQKLAEDTPCCEGSKNTKVVDKARIVFRCNLCGEFGDKEGEACWNDECREKGGKYCKTCEKSTVWPHGGEAPRKKAPKEEEDK